MKKKIKSKSEPRKIKSRRPTDPKDTGYEDVVGTQIIVDSGYGSFGRIPSSSAHQSTRDTRSFGRGDF